MEPVTVHFKLSQAEWVSAYRQLLRRNKVLTTLALLVCACWLLTFALMPLAPSFGFYQFPYLVPALVATFLVPRHILSTVPRRYYRGDRKFRGGVTLTFTDEFIQAQGKLIESKVRWELYTDVLEDEQMYLLVYGQDLNTLTPIPKRAFKRKGDEQAFRALVFPRFDRKLEARAPQAPELAEDDYQPASLQPPDWR